MFRKVAVHSHIALILAGVILPSRAEPEFRISAGYPDKAFPGALIAGRDGYLYGTITQIDNRKPGSIYRLSPDGGVTTLRRFGEFRDTYQPNVGGYFPGPSLVTASDGCLYGITIGGGLFANGVLYRIRPDGDYAVVADLDLSQIPSDLGLHITEHEFRNMVEGPDHAFYFPMFQTGSLARIGRDGKITLVGSFLKGATFLPDPENPLQFIALRTFQKFGGRPWLIEHQLRVQKVRIPDGVVVEDTLGPELGLIYSSMYPFAWTPEGLLIGADVRDDPAQRQLLFRFRMDGTMPLVAEFSLSSDGPLPPPIASFMAEDPDGTLRYLTEFRGYSSKAVTLVERKPDGTSRTLCGFGDHPVYHLIKGPGTLYSGATRGSSIYVPNDGNGYHADWMAEENASAYTVLQGSPKGGVFFHIGLDGITFPPLADVDLVRLKRGKDATVAVLKNDRDPSEGAIRISGTGPTALGDLEIVSDRSGGQVLRFSPTDGGRRSVVFPYEISVANGRTSSGTVMLRGDCSGIYKDAGRTVRGSKFSITVKPAGDFSAFIPTASGRSVRVSGRLDWQDAGVAITPQLWGAPITLSVSLGEDSHGTPALNYRIRETNDFVVEGQAILD